MSILKRFTTIMSSNINAMLDKMEDPAKMVDQLMRDLTKNLSEVKAETAAVMAEESRAGRQVSECREDIAKYTNYAEKAVLAGNDGDARKFLEEKNKKQTQLAALETAYNVAKDNAGKMRQMHDKLQAQIAELDSKRASIKAATAVAGLQDKVNKMTSSVDSASINKFNEMEEKANKMLDTAAAMAELNKPKDDISDLERKYASEQPTSAVDDELAALKAKLNSGN